VSRVNQTGKGLNHEINNIIKKIEIFSVGDFKSLVKLFGKFEISDNYKNNYCVNVSTNWAKNHFEIDF
jgi:hypothetical protein